MKVYIVIQSSRETNETFVRAVFDTETKAWSYISDCEQEFSFSYFDVIEEVVQ